MYIAVLLPSILALVALFKNKLTYAGLISAWLMAIIITYCGGLYPSIALALTFILTILSDNLKKKKDKDGKRTAYQMISNVLTCTLCTILYYYKQNDMFIVMYYAVLGGSLADTLASSIGALAKGTTYDPLTFRKMSKGESGAISTLGLAASVIGGMIVGGIHYLNGGWSYEYIIIIIMSTLGSYVDSVMGAYLQGKFKCSKCNKQVEEDKHCGRKTKLINGYAFMTNDTVNLISNIIVFISTYISMVLR